MQLIEEHDLAPLYEPDDRALQELMTPEYCHETTRCIRKQLAALKTRYVPKDVSLTLIHGVGALEKIAWQT